jgi:hypothetical protein
MNNIKCKQQDKPVRDTPMANFGCRPTQLRQPG